MKELLQWFGDRILSPQCALLRMAANVVIRLKETWASIFSASASLDTARHVPFLSLSLVERYPSVLVMPMQ